MVEMLATPCKCGWRYPGFHICVDLSRPIPREIAIKHGIIPDPEKKKKKIQRSEDHMAAINDGRAARWQRHREETAERDLQILDEYKNGMGFRQISIKHGMGYGTVVKVMKRFANEGLVDIRPRGDYRGKVEKSQS